MCESVRWLFFARTSSCSDGPPSRHDSSHSIHCVAGKSTLTEASLRIQYHHPQQCGTWNGHRMSGAELVVLSWYSLLMAIMAAQV